MTNSNNGQIQIPKTVGYYLFDPQVKLGVTKKRSWFHRKMIEWVLGWKWEDAK